MSIAIKAEHVSKEYRLGIINHGVLFRDIQSWWARKTGKPDPHSKIGAEHFADQEDRFWALKDVSFEIEQGDRVGIIGRNGAGKSTLLKILSRITEPTEGRVAIKGRVASLLEVGTGFHPELTGRDNIYLNGALLGMKRREVNRKLDEIVDFSEIKQFIDTPVKRYSSGMYVRLAFAVAAHLESEILVADEVLAVGDIEFQKKCLGKMEDISRIQGRTVLFVSHNLSTIKQLCSSGFLLEKGLLKARNSNINTLVKEYIIGNNKLDICSTGWKGELGQFNPHFNPHRAYIGDEKGEQITRPIANNENAYLYIFFVCEIPDPALEVSYSLHSESGDLIYCTQSTDQAPDKWPRIKKGDNFFRSCIPYRFLNEGTYSIRLTASLYLREWLLDPLNTPIQLVFSVQGGLSDSPYWTVKRPGLLAPVLKWENYPKMSERIK